MQVLHVALALRVESPDEECVERGIILLLLMQVHLQNEGGAGDVSDLTLEFLEVWLTSC